MKKFAYLCVILLINMNLIAQIDPYDRNWDTIVFDHFDQPNRQFDNTYWEPDSIWIAFSPRNDPSGITKWSNEIRKKNFQAYQWHHCWIDSHHSVLKLFSDFKSEYPILCDYLPYDYNLPPYMFGKHWNCDTRNQDVRYYSGMIESVPTSRIPNERNPRSPHYHGRFRYGYFEIKLKSPVHRGCHSAFWLWDNQEDEHYYEAIDIFEHTWDYTGNGGVNQGVYELGDPRVFTSGVKFSSISSDSRDAKEYARVYPRIPDNEADLTGWHVFSCEWLPERVTFYRDGNFVSQEDDSIPSHPLALKTTYAIDRYVFNNYTQGTDLIWKGTDTMYVDYIKVLQLRCDCDTEEVITCQTELDTFNYGVKKSISITSSIGDVIVADTSHVTFRATDSFLISGPFQANVGGELTVIMQECPDNTVNFSPLYNKKETP